MRVTTKARYALRAILNLAASDNSGPISIRNLAEHEGISAEFLEQIFFKMKKAGIIKSTRGPGGGFQMNLAPSEVSVKMIFDAVEEGVMVTPCTEEGVFPREACDRIDDCIAHSVWQKATNHVREYLDSITLEDIISDIPRQLLEKKAITKNS
jgi:Rrf2 family transcriptional regulator, iron-sulfur cluster assembly transcription factor